MRWKRSVALLFLCAAPAGLAAPGAAQSAPANAAPAAAPDRFEALLGEAKQQMLADPEKALAAARAALAVAASGPAGRDRTLALAQGRWLEGEALTRLNRPDEARPIIAAALQDAIALDPRGKLHGDLLLSIATINWTTGDVRRALDQFQTAHGIYAALGEARSQAKALQYLGTIYFDARDYERMLRYYRHSADVYSGDPALLVTAFNNTGDAHKELGRHDQAIADYQRALAVAREMDSPLLEVRIQTNIASAYARRGEHARAEAVADRGLRRATGHETGWEPFLWGVKAQAAMARGDLATAERHVARTFGDADLATTTLQFREFHETAYRLYEKLGDAEAALAHLAAFKRLDDEVREIAASTNSALSTARFDFTSQELRITKLNANKLAQDVQLQRSRALLLYGALGVGALLLAGALIGFFSIRRSRDQVRDANESLSEVNVELEKALSAKTRFLATTSHEIRTPLNGILGMTQVMLHDASLGAEHRGRVRVVHDAGQTMKALVDDILDVAKIEGGKLVLERAVVELRALLEGVANLWRDQAVAKGLEVAVDLGDAPERAMGDARRLRQIVFNLMSNAVKFTESGRVELRAAAEGDRLVLRVTDTGIGIAPEYFGTVFQSFEQVDGEVTRRFGGTGLGLAICRDLTEAMGGTVELESELGRGSTFTVRLPLERGAASVAANAPGAEEAGWPELGAARLLVIEPNPLTRSVIAAVLGQLVGKVEAVAGPAEAGGMMRHHLVADLPALGDDVVEQVAAFAGAGSAVTLLAAEAPTPEVYAALVRAGAVQILQRPFPPAELAEAVKRAHEARAADAAAVGDEDARRAAAA